MFRPAVPTLSSAIDRFIIEDFPHRSQRCRATMAGMLEFWRRRLGHRRIHRITPGMLSEVRAEIVPGRAAATVNRYMATLSAVYTRAIRDWGLQVDHVPRRLRRLKEAPGRIRYLRTPERVRFLAECKRSNSMHLYAAVLLSICLGLRRGELLALRWDDVDVEARLVTIHRTKTNQTAVLPLPQACLDELEWLRRRSAHDRIFPVSPRKAFDNAVRRAGLRDFRWHDLRHTFASYAIQNGADSAHVQAGLGHSTAAMTKRYTHLNAAHLRPIVDRLGELVENP